MSNRDTRPKGRQRASTPRSKTGCITCKMRRLKCGEEKPGCNRCKKSGWKCDGYEHGSSSRSTPLPRTPSPMSSFYSPSVSLNLDEKEQNYFQAYVQQRTTFTDHSNNEDAFWKQTVLQECVQNTCVRHVIVAQGALALSQVSQTPWAGYYKVNPTQDAHHDFALIQYDKALRVLRTSISELPRGKGARSTLISALALSYFDCSCGNGGFAAKHIRFGRKLLTAWKSGDQNTNSTSSDTPPIFESLQASTKETSALLHPNDQRGNLNKSDIGFVDVSLLAQLSLPTPPEREATQQAEDPIDEYLVRIFLRLDINIFLFLGVDSECNYDNTFILDVPYFAIPAQFSSFEEARRAKLLLLAHGYQFFLGTMKYRFQPKDRIPESIQRLRQHWLEQILSWSSAFEPVLRMYGSDPNIHPFARAETSRLPTITMLMWLTGTLHTPESAYDDLIPHFEYLVSVAEEVIEFEKTHTDTSLHSDEIESYTFEVRIIPALYLVATKCRLDALRYRAITLLLSSRRREGIWDSILCGKVADWLFRLERDAGLDWNGRGRAPQKWDGFADEDRGVWGESIERDLQGRRAVVRCRQNVPLVRGGGWTELSSVVEW